jgi:hypothetical protein
MSNYPVTEDFQVVDVYYVDNIKIMRGMTTNQILEILPADLMTQPPNLIGKDKDGFVVEWHYPNLIITYAYCVSRYESAYVVQQIQVKNEHVI